MGSRAIAAIGCTLMAVAILATPVQATFPGENGRILGDVTVDSSGDIVSVDPVTGQSTVLTSGARSPAASPDGSKIVFSRFGAVWVMNAYGTDEVQLNQGFTTDGAPTWSPDGTQIAFRQNLDDNGPKIYVMDADGQNAHPITSSSVIRTDEEPEWSPDGQWIAFTRREEGLMKVRPDGTGQALLVVNGSRPSWSPDGHKILHTKPSTGLYTIDVDGTNPTTVTTNAGGEGAFSPDGRRIAFGAGAGCCFLWTMNADGSNRSQLAPIQVNEIDWQPIPVNSYPRPKGASPLRVSLVVAFPQCTSPNAWHGPPLEHPSCGDPFHVPVGNSQHVTVGTPDTNGAAANFVGTLRMGVQPGNPATPADEADVGLRVSATDIRCKAAGAPDTCGMPNVVGADYVGELQARVTLRITDKDNTPGPDGPGAATTMDIPYAFTIACTETVENIGSTCQVDTTADAVLPGAVKERVRAVWQLGQVEVLDGGPDGDVDTPTDGQVFLRQGIFVP